MKKIFFLLVAGMTVVSALADSPRKMERVNNPNQKMVTRKGADSYILNKTEKYEFSKGEKVLVNKALKTNVAEMVSEKAKIPLQTIDAKDVRRAIVAPRAEELPVAFYWRPEGTMFLGVDRETFMLSEGGLVGSWLNGVESWVYPNGSANATDVSYKSFMSENGGTVSVNENGDFVDATTPTMKGNPGYLYSWSMPMQIASNELGKDTFGLSMYDKPTDAGIMAGLGLTAAGVPYLYDDGMWSLMNAPLFDCYYGVMRQLIWGTTAEGVQYALGTTPVTVKKTADTDTTLNIAGFQTFYDKPQSPLYVKDITLWITSLGAPVSGQYPMKAPELASTDTLRLGIFDAKGNLIKSTKATKDNLKYYEGDNVYGGGILTFPLNEPDGFGGFLSEGITLTDTFSIAVFGLDRCTGDFGIFMAYEPYTGGRTLMIDDKGMPRQYAYIEPFMMLNGVYNTFEDAFPYLTFDGGAKPDPVVNELVFESMEFGEGEFFDVAVFDERSGNVAGSYPLLMSSFYPSDTINNTPHYGLDAPDWIQWAYDDYYWEHPNLTDVIGIMLIADPLPEGLTGREDDVTLSCYGQSITYHVTQGTPPSGISEITANRSKVFSTADAFNFTYPAEFTSMEVYNVSGQKVSAYALPQTGTFSIAKSELSDGIYLFRMNGAKAEVLRAIK